MTPNSYQSYSTALKVYYSLGLQQQFVPEHIQSKIPDSTKSSWKNLSVSTIVGAELEQNVGKNLEEMKLLYSSYGTFPRKMATIQIRLMMLIISCFNKTSFQKAIRKQKIEFINFLERFEQHISYKQLAKLLGISFKTLYYWRTQVKFKCEHSALLLCAKRDPNQATISEVGTMKKWLSKPEFSHWGIHSIWALAFKSGETALSLPAWYHYNQLLRIRLHAKKRIKPPRNPIRAVLVNQIWHADITIFKTLDGVKHYIYNVMDNYSRFVHSWHIDTVVSANVRLQTIKDAIHKAFGENSFDNLQLVTDGGPENDNFTIKEFIQHSNINHTIALKDIEQSNSMMEAFYHTAKHQYLYQKSIHNTQELFIKVEEMIHEYNFIKPHYALGIYTPNEVKNGTDLNISHSNTFAQAAQKRREINKNMNCIQGC